MAVDDATADDERHPALLRRTLAASSTLASVLGFVLPLVALATWETRPGQSALLLAALLAVTDGITDRFRVEFSFRGRPVEFSVGVMTSVAAIAFLPPPLAPAVLLPLLLRELASRRMVQALDVGMYALAMFAAATLVGALGVDVTGTWALPVGVLAAIAFDAASLLLVALVLEADRRGASIAYAREGLVVTAFNVAVPALTVAVVAPFADRVHLLVGLVLLLQVCTYGALRMLQSEQHHRERSRLLHDGFSRYVPASVVDELEARGTTVELGGEELDVTVMFVDVRSFTSWSQQLAPADVLEQLNELLHELTAAVFDSGGTLDKFTGDGLMAFWGAPVTQDDHADRACRAALDMLGRTDRHNARRRAAGLPDLQVGIGICSGQALVGNVGHADRLDYTAIGDTVNTAARIEGATRRFDVPVLIAETTHELLADERVTRAARDCGHAELRGRTGTIRLWSLQAAAAAANVAA